MNNYQIKTLNVSQIKVDQDNPRLPKTSSQREALNKMFETQGDKLIALAKNIVTHGLNPTERTLIFKSGKEYIGGDGNRRITVLKALATPDLLDNLEWKEKIKKIRTEPILKKVECAVFKNREAARLWISLNHQGQGNGEGRIPWGPREKDRFNNVESIGTQITNKYANARDRGKYQKTTMDRVFSYKFVKELLNIQQDKQGTVDFSKIKGKLAKDIVNSLKNAKVSTVYTVKETNNFLGPLINENTSSQKSNPTTQSRKGVIPKEFNLAISDQKTNNVFGELKTIEVRKFPNASAMLLRTFLELTVYVYCKKHEINFHKNDPLKNRFRNAVEAMPLDQGEKKTLNPIIFNQNHPANTSILNSYVHNLSHHPDPQSVKTAFDNLKPFFVQAFKQ